MDFQYIFVVKPKVGDSGEDDNLSKKLDEVQSTFEKASKHITNVQLENFIHVNNEIHNMKEKIEIKMKQNREHLELKMTTNREYLEDIVDRMELLQDEIKIKMDTLHDR